MKKLAKTAIACLTIATLAACTDAEELVTKELYLDKLQGRWIVCYGTAYPSFEFFFEGRQLTRYFVYHEDENCTLPISASHGGQFEIVIGDSIKTDSGVIARTIEYREAINGVAFDIYYINQNILYLGDHATGDGYTLESRPTDIDYLFQMIKTPNIDYSNIPVTQ